MEWVNIPLQGLYCRLVSVIVGKVTDRSCKNPGYGSRDYTRINPAMDEHGEINILIFNGLTGHDGDNQVVPGLAKDPAFAFICYIDANYVAKASIQGIAPDTIMGHHGVGIFWNVADWTIEE